MIERNWKKAYDEDFCEEGQSVAVEKTGLTVAQKYWLVRAWTFVFGEVPNAMPDEERDDGMLAVKRARDRRNHHHRYPQGASIRLAQDDPDRPENIVPLDEFNHIGRGLVGECEPDSPIIHQDDAWAFQHYNGQHPTSYEIIAKERRDKTSRGESYWNQTYDGWFKGLAEMVVGKYKQAHPEDEWPKHEHRIKRKGRKIWREDLMSWIERE